jgi:LacI family transcriptional regulator
MKVSAERPKPVTLLTLARALGLSRSTVSAVLSGDERYSEDTTKRVLDVAEFYNYQPNRSAQTVRRGRSNMIGVMHSGGTLQVVNERAHFLGQYIAETGYELLLSDVLWHPKGTEAVVDHMLASRVEGVVFSAGASMDRSVNHRIFDRFRKANIPVVCVSHEPTKGIPVVNTDFAEGFRLLTEHLIASGHRRLSLLLACHPEHTWHDPLRLAGFTEAIENAGGRVAPAVAADHYKPEWKGRGIQGEVIYYTGAQDSIFSASQAPQHAVGMLLDAGFNSDALLASNDEWASSAVSVCLRRGISVPGQMAVTGFDDSDLAVLCPVPLTTVSQQSEETCQIAVDLLMKRMRGGQDRAQTVVLPCKLIVRSSSVA